MPVKVQSRKSVKSMNVLNIDKRAMVLNCLAEGNSMRATCRLTGVAKKTCEKLLRDAGKACREYQDKVMRNLPCKRLQVDEVWSFTYCKAKNIPERLNGEQGIGDTWTWVAIDADSKLIPCWRVGKRTASDAYWFIHDLKERLAERVQLTSDGLRCYVEAVEDAFGSEIDFAQLIKLYGNELPQGPEMRYSPPICVGARKERISGNPDPRCISTSFAERQNLTMRMSMRRFTRLTNGFSKKLENHAHAVALHFMHYNFCRIHQTLRVTPAMQAGVADHVWSMEEVVELIGGDSNG